MTNILLIIIIALFAVICILQVYYGQRVFSSYATTYNVKRQVAIFDTLEEMSKSICEQQWWSDYEVVSVFKDNDKYVVVFQSKEIKTT